MKLKDEAERMMHRFFEGKPEKPLEIILGGFLVTLLFVGVSVVAVALAVTTPLWGLPYLIYKCRKDGKDETD